MLGNLFVDTGHGHLEWTMAAGIGQGYLLSSLDIFYFSEWLVMLLVPLCWLVRRPSGGAAAVAAE